MYYGPWEDVDYEDEDEDETVLRGRTPFYNRDIYLPFEATCPDCGFTSRDVKLLQNHKCDIEENGGYCEDFPCCGHERGDCNGQLYGSDEAIKADVYRAMRDPEYDEYYGGY